MEEVVHYCHQLEMIHQMVAQIERYSISWMVLGGQEGVLEEELDQLATQELAVVEEVELGDRQAKEELMELNYFSDDQQFVCSSVALQGY